MSLRDYFSNNKIFTGTEKPTQGKFDVGDIVVNIGENATEEPMWICVEAGTPGVWEICSGADPNAVSAIEYTDGMDIQIDGGEIGNMSELQTSEKGSIVGAINELFQSANNGKELIANAIGEPLNAEDTFQAMSTDINGLLATFKTNMMNSGVMVESSDKFKQLIEKIKGLTEGEGNKGIQIASGVKDSEQEVVQGQAATGSSTVTSRYLTKLIINDIKFKPDFIIAYSSTWGHVICYFNNKFYTVTTKSTDYGSEINTSDLFFVNDDTISMPVIARYTSNEPSYSFEYYMFGVGEEDTTLRDSLASILQGEGVEVTEEDDMASLITKVDEEFDRKNANRGLDIISATELPDTGKENQICVITDNLVDNFLVTADYNDVGSEEEIIIYLGSTASGNIPEGSLYTIVNGNVIIKYNIVKIYQGENVLDSYYYSNGEWVQLTIAWLYLLEKGVFKNNSYFGGMRTGDAWTQTTEGIQFISDKNHPYAALTTNNKINFSAYKTVEITGYTAYGSYPLQIRQMTEAQGYTTAYVDLIDGVTVNQLSNNLEATLTTISYDISSWQGEYYFGLFRGSNGAAFNITDIKFK